MVVEVVAISQHHDRRVGHRRVQDHASRVESHRQALARTLRVPHDTDAPIANVATRPLPRLIPPRRLHHPARRRTQGLFHRDVHGMELMITGHLFDELATAATGSGILEHNKIPQQIEKAALLEHALQHDLQLGQVRGGILAPRDRAPGLEPFLARAERADARLHAIGDDQCRVGSEQSRNLCLIRLKLLIGRPDRCILVGGIL